jgi:hypothetical protein
MCRTRRRSRNPSPDSTLHLQIAEHVGAQLASIMIVTITNNAYFSLGSKTLGQMVGGYYSKDMMDISYCPSWKRHAFGLNGSQSLFTMFRRQARCDHCFEWPREDESYRLNCKDGSKRIMPSMRIELISEDIYSFAEVISEYETSVLTVKLRGRIRAV